MQEHTQIPMEEKQGFMVVVVKSWGEAYTILGTSYPEAVQEARVACGRGSTVQSVVLLDMQGERAEICKGPDPDFIDHFSEWEVIDHTL